MALEAGNLQAAAEQLTLALASEPEDPLLEVRLAETYIAMGNAARAREILEGVLARDPGWDAALVAMGDLALAQGHPDDADAWYDHAIDAEPTSTTAYDRLLALRRNAGDPAGALEIAEQILAVDPSREDVLLQASEICLDLMLIDEAFLYMARYIDQAPVVPGQEDRYGAVLGLAAKLVEGGDTERAMFLYRTYLGMFPEDVEAASGLARALVAVGDTIGARSIIAAIPDPEPEAPAGRKLIGPDLYLAAGAPDTCLLELTRLFGKLDPTLPIAVKETWVRALVGAFRLDEARKALETFGADEVTARTAAAADLAVALVQMWRFGEAWDVITTGPGLLAERLEVREVRKALVVLVLAAEDAALVESVHKALEYHPEGRLVLAEASFFGHVEPDGEALVDALAEIHAAGVSDGARVDAWALEAICTIEGVCKAKPTHLLALTTRMAELEPADPRLPGLKAMFALSAGNEDRALTGLEEALRSTPLDPLVKVWLAELLGEEDPSRAGSLLETAFLLRPTPYVLGRIAACK